jgi:hypothetical protein
MSNRSLRNNRRHRYAARQRGGSNTIPAFGVGNLDTLTGSIAGAGTTGAGSGYAVPLSSWGPANAGCDAISRTDTALNTQANPDIAGTNQYPILGGNVVTPPFSSTVPPISNAVQFPPTDLNARQMGGARTHRHRRGQTCPLCKRKQRGGGCGCMQRGGGSPQGAMLTPGFQIGGDGPNVGGPLVSQSGCDPRAGSPEDSHSPLARIHQAGGSYMSLASAAPLDVAYSSPPQPSYGAANAFSESCYKAPGSEQPVYNNNSTAFNFSPSLTENNTLPPGVNVYNDVIQQPGRMGAQSGGSRRRKNRQNRKSRNQRKSRNNRKNRKNY